MTRLVLLLGFLLIAPTCLSAQSTDRSAIPVISPGIKLGYSSGEGGGFTMGFELTVGRWNDNNGLFYGGVFDVDFTTRGRFKVHIGAEGMYGPVGIEMGPTLVGENGNISFGSTVTPCIGLFFMPYYSATAIAEQPTITEWGAYLKYPVNPNGGEIMRMNL